MSLRHAHRAGTLALSLLAFGATALCAQSLPNAVGAHNAAQHAAAATSARIDAAQGAPSPARSVPPRTAPGSARPAASAKSGSPGSAHAKSGAPATTVAATTVAATSPSPKAGESSAASSVAERGGKSEISLVRETFSYSVDGRRDPFVSLMRTGDLRPTVSDLRLVTVVYDPTGRSVAILRDLTTKEQYRVKVWQTLGRMRVAQIQPRAVTFTVEAIGTTYPEVLTFNDTTRARSQ